MLFGEYRSDFRVVIHEFGVEEFRELSLWEKKNPFELIQIPGNISAKMVLYFGCGLREKE